MQIRVKSALMMRLVMFTSVAVCLGIFASCKPAAAPISISNRPVSVNDVRQPATSSKPLGEMTWTAMDGNEQKVGDLQGKVLVLDFWATYCEPCRQEIPHLNSIQAKYGPNDVMVVGLNVGGDDDRPKIPAFVKELKMAYQVAFPDDELLSYVSGDDDRIPQTAVFDRHGNLVEKFVGFDPTVQSQLDRAVETALKQ
jgi:thiol-disulfide isomerase/thioredoxin